MALRLKPEPREPEGDQPLRQDGWPMRLAVTTTVVAAPIIMTTPAVIVSPVAVTAPDMAGRPVADRRSAHHGRGIDHALRRAIHDGRRRRAWCWRHDHRRRRIIHRHPNANTDGPITCVGRKRGSQQND